MGSLPALSFKGTMPHSAQRGYHVKGTCRGRVAGSRRDGVAKVHHSITRRSRSNHFPSCWEHPFLTIFTLQLVVAAGPIKAAEDLPALLRDVSEIAAPGVPGQLAVFGKDAFVVVTGRNGNLAAPVVAAARWGKARIIAFGHDGYFGAEAIRTADTAQFLLNAIKWCGGPPVAVLAAHPAVHQLCVSRGLPSRLVTPAELPEALRTARVFCGQISRIPQQLLPHLEKFLESGGGIIAAETGWGWLQLNPGKTLNDHPANKLLGRTGVVWTDGTMQRTSPQGFDAKTPISELCHAGKAIEFLSRFVHKPPDHPSGVPPSKNNQSREAEELNIEQALFSFQQALRSLPSEEKWFWQKVGELADVEKQPRPTVHRPVTRLMVEERLRIIAFAHWFQRLPAEEIPAHPADFPGTVPRSLPRRTLAVWLDPGKPGWQSTGCYAPPGEVITLELPQGFEPQGLVVQIGCHTDELWHLPRWTRIPAVVIRQPVTSQTARVASPYGGLIYFEFRGARSQGPLPITLSGVVEAPRFVRGKTSIHRWKEILSEPTAPWAEFESSKIILTVPTTAARKVEDPEATLAFWDRVLDACAELAARDPERPRPERIVTDRQISAGYMHAGYPIMTHLDVADQLVAPPTRHTDPRWGLFHEIGHNHQESDWTFSQVGEVTCNLFTVYVLETVCGMTDRTAMHPGLRNREQRIQEYFREGPSLDRFARDPFLGLIPYLQLQETFGWEAYKQVFASYRKSPPKPRLTNDLAKIDEWVVRFSQVVGRNLAPFHRAWGLPVSEAAEAKVAHLPVWMPPGFPPEN